ncbi:MAG: addiction module protein [Verrucomicrobia bacterium]|nr:addiction module protein [Verrucomicrobiota bacterium]
MDATQIEQMSFAERIQTMELLWRAISSHPEEVSSPSWHGELLAERTAKIERGEAAFLTIDQVKERLQKRPA